jgi:uracil-DNA glycosylase family 4
MVETTTGLSRELVASYLNQLHRCGVKELHLPPDWKEALAGAPARKPNVVREEAGEVSVTSPEILPARTFGSREEKQEALDELRERVMADEELRARFARARQLVFGVGSADADIFFIGEAPGEDEDKQGEPFVGKAGQLLTKMIGAMGLSREEVYIGNIVKYRPDMPEGSRGNRKPTPEEMALCLPILLEQIQIIQPRVMVALGATAVEGLFHLSRAGITSLRGTWKQFREIPVMPTFHPAYLLRNQSLSEKRKVWEDLLQVMERTGMPISEKQRNYFLKHL